MVIEGTDTECGTRILRVTSWPRPVPLHRRARSEGRAHFVWEPRMIFLIEYNRKKGRIINLKSFDDSDRVKAQDRRLELELSMNAKGVEHEVVLLEAESEAAIRITHGRYFYDLSELIARFKEAPEAA